MHTSAVSHAVVSTASPFIYLSKTDYLNFRDSITNAGPNSRAALQCRNILYSYCFSAQPCSNFSSELSALTIRLTNLDYVIPAAGYLLDGYQSHGCAVAVSYVSDQQNIYILGTTFLRSFYTEFDYQTNRIMFAVNANAASGTEVKQVLSGWLIFACFVGATVAALVLCIGTYCGVKKLIFSK